MTEIRFVPDDAASLDAMFVAMSECQVQNRRRTSSLNLSHQVTWLLLSI